MLYDLKENLKIKLRQKFTLYKLRLMRLIGKDDIFR